MVTIENAYIKMFKKEAEKQGCTDIELLNINGVKILRLFNADFLMDISEEDSDYVASCTKIDDMGEIEYGILFGSEFNKFSKETQEVIMFHEIGHALYPIVVVNKESDMKSELLADLYAIEQTSFEQYMLAMRETSEYFNGIYDEEMIKSFTESRINNVKKELDLI